MNRMRLEPEAYRLGSSGSEDPDLHLNSPRIRECRRVALAARAITDTRMLWGSCGIYPAGLKPNRSPPQARQSLAVDYDDAPPVDADGGVLLHRFEGASRH